MYINGEKKTTKKTARLELIFRLKKLKNRAIEQRQEIFLRSEHPSSSNLSITSISKIFIIFQKKNSFLKSGGYSNLIVLTVVQYLGRFYSDPVEPFAVLSFIGNIEWKGF